MLKKLKKIYSVESKVEEFSGKIESISRRGHFFLNGKKINCAKLSHIMILREAKKLEHRVVVLVHKETGHFFGRCFNNNILVNILKTE